MVCAPLKAWHFTSFSASSKRKSKERVKKWNSESHAQLDDHLLNIQKGRCMLSSTVESGSGATWPGHFSLYQSVHAILTHLVGVHQGFCVSVGRPKSFRIAQKRPMKLSSSASSSSSSPGHSNNSKASFRKLGIRQQACSWAPLQSQRLYKGATSS